MAMKGLLPDSATFTIGRRIVRRAKRRSSLYDKRTSEAAGLIYGVALLAVFLVVKALVWNLPRWAWRKVRA